MKNAIQVGEWIVNESVHEISKGTITRKLQPKHIELLLYLVKHQGQVVRKEHIIDDVWADRYVVEGVLKRCIAELRKAFDDSVRTPEYIETVIKKGYRLIAPVRILDNGESTTGSESNIVANCESPFRSLRAFEFQHATYFFGREQAIEETNHALHQQIEAGRAFLLILGMSGIGKSSLVQAGMLPRLVQDSHDDSNDLLRRAVFRYSDNVGDIFHILALALLSGSALPELTGQGYSSDDLTGLLANLTGDSLGLLKQSLLPSIQASRSIKLVLVIDQMEELFTFNSVSDEQRMQFFAVLDLMARSEWIWVIATMRSDLYPRCLDYPQLMALKQGYGQYDLLPPSAIEIERIIKQSAAAAGLQYECDAETGQHLSKTLLDAMQQHPWSLPLLEFTLEELYVRRQGNTLTYDAYRDIGGIAGCLVERAESTFNRLSEDVKSQLPYLFSALTQIDSHKDNHIGAIPVMWDNLAHTSAMQELVDTYVQARLLVSHTDDNANISIRFAHEALIRYWPRLAEWVLTNKQNLLVHQRVAESAIRWQQESQSNELLLAAGKPLGEAEALRNSTVSLNSLEQQYIEASSGRAQRAVQVRQWVFTALVALSIFSISGAYLAEKQKNNAIAANQLAQTEVKTANAVTDFLIGIFTANDPNQAGDLDMTAKQLLSQGVERLDVELSEQPEIRSKLQHAFGRIYRHSGDYDQALTFFQDALSIRKQVYGNSHTEVALILNELSALELNFGNYRDAKTYIQKALQIYREQGLDNSQNAAMAYSDLALVLKELGEYAEAEAVIKRSLAFWQGAGLENDINYYNALDTLGALLVEKGDLAGGLSIRQQVLALTAKDDPLRPVALNNVAHILSRMDNLEAAEPLLIEGIEATIERFGRLHQRTAQLLFNLAKTHERMQHYSEAEAEYKEALQIMRSIDNEAHAGTGLIIASLARLDLQQGDYQKCIEHSTDAKQRLIRHYPNGHHRVVSVQLLLGECLLELSDYESAEGILLAAYQELLALQGDRSQDISRARDLIVRLYDRWGKSDKIQDLNLTPNA